MNVTRRREFLRLLLGTSAFAALARAEAHAQDYTYDALGRLKTVSYPNGAVTSYNYDATDDRTSVVTTGGSGIQITGTGPVNLRTLANAVGYNGASDATYTFVVGNGVTITGAAGGGIAIDSGTWPTGSYAITLTLIVENGGIVRGGGGNGGAGGDWTDGYAGGAGGDAVYCRLPMTIEFQTGSQVRGGGGGGGGGGVVQDGWPEPDTFSGGGGGGGAPNGAGGAAGSYGWSGTAGTSGTTSGGGFGGNSSGSSGGAGGNYGAPGGAGTSWFSPPVSGGAGGPAGYCVRKNGHTIPVTNNGSTSGAIA